MVDDDYLELSGNKKGKLKQITAALIAILEQLIHSKVTVFLPDYQNERLVLQDPLLCLMVNIETISDDQAFAIRY